MIRNIVLLTGGLLFIVFSALPAQTFQWTRYSTRASLFGAATATGVDVDAQGNRFITGFFDQTMQIENDSLTSAGGRDIFVAKYDSSGNFLWSARAGGPLHDQANGIAVDPAGNCYLTGTFQGTALFDTLSMTSIANLNDIFVAKYSTDGQFLWTARAGGQVPDNANAIAVNQDGKVFVCGDFRISAFFYDAGAPLPADTLYSATAVSSDLYTACYSAGGGFLWAKSAGGPTGESANAITTDRHGNCLVSGYFFDSALFDGQTLTSEGGQDIFIAKYTDSGNLLQAKGIGGPDWEDGYDISVDSSDNIYICGNVSNTLVLGQDSLSWVNGGGAFLAKLNADMNPMWAREPESFNFTGITLRSIDVSSSGQCYVSGNFNGARAIFGGDTLRSAPGREEMLIAHYTGDGDVVWARQAGRTAATVIAYEVTVDQNGRSTAAGSYSSYSIFGQDTLENGPGFFLTRFSNSSPVAVTPRPATIERFTLHQNYPNPFNPTTTIEFDLPAASVVSLDIYDIIGRHVETPYRASLSPGNHKFIWNGADAAGNPLASGVYFYRLTVEGMRGLSKQQYSQTRKMFLVK